MSMSINVTDKVMGKDLNIPTIPEVFARISSMAQDPDVGIPEIGQVVAQDPPLASKVLKIVNCASYGMREKVASCEHATSVLGIRVLRNVVLQASVMGNYDYLYKLYDLTAIWKHSILSAQVAAQIARVSRAELPIGVDEVYTCGLLHNIGMLVLLDCAKEEYAKILVESSSPDGASSEGKLWSLEEESLGFTHCEVGAMVARRWDLPECVVEAVLYHHEPASADRDGALPYLIQLAALIANHAAAGESAEFVLCRDTERELALTPEAVEELIEFARESYASIEL